MVLVSLDQIPAAVDAIEGTVSGRALVLQLWGPGIAPGHPLSQLSYGRVLALTWGQSRRKGTGYHTVSRGLEWMFLYRHATAIQQDRNIFYLFNYFCQLNTGLQMRTHTYLHFPHGSKCVIYFSYTWFSGSNWTKDSLMLIWFSIFILSLA